jgi:hypothetical protein
MRATDHADLIARYRAAGNALDIHVTASERLVDAYGLAFLRYYVTHNLREELRLGDAFEEVSAELAAVLLEEDIIPFEEGYYKLDANGFPRFFEGSFCEAPIGVKP